jgi:hypothetical protein
MKIARPVLVAASLALGLFATQRSVSARAFDQAVTRIAGAWKPGTIPANGPPSAAPTLAEWDAVREVDVGRSTEYHCETKVVREWFRATCRSYESWKLKAPRCKQANGDQCLTWVDPSGKGEKASIVHRLRRGQNYQLEFVWDPGNVAYVLAINVDQAGGATASF